MFVVFANEAADLLSSLREMLSEETAHEAKENAVYAFMQDINSLYSSMFLKELLKGECMEGNTKYLSSITQMPIMVNSISFDGKSLQPSEVSEMHVGKVDGKEVLLITPTILAMGSRVKLMQEGVRNDY